MNISKRIWNDYPGSCWQPKQNAQETYLWSVLQNKGKCWIEFYKYVKWHKVNRENVPIFTFQLIRLTPWISIMLLYLAVSDYQWSGETNL